MAGKHYLTFAVLLLTLAFGLEPARAKPLPLPYQGRGAGGEAAAPGRWSSPTLVSTTTWSSWFPEIAVDDAGRAYLVWASGTTQRGESLDQVLFSTWDGTGWSRPNDIFAPSTGGFNVRPVIAVDSAGQLHMIYREHTTLRYTQAPAESAWRAGAWQPGWPISGGGGYYSALAVDNRGTIHIVWSEPVSDEPIQAVVWFGTDAGATRLMAGKWELYQAAQGLTDGVVHAIIEDRLGNQWFGTDRGVFRFDGVNWFRITVADGLADNQVRAIYEDRQGAIWFGTARGASRYAPSSPGQSAGGYVSEQVNLKTYTSRDGLAGDGVNAIVQDQQGALWFGTDAGLSRFDGTNWISYHQGSGSHTLARNRVLALHVDQLGVLWVGTERGLTRMDGENWQQFTSADGLAGDRVYAILEDPQGALWFGTDRGVSRYDGTTWQTEASVGDVPVYALLRDSDGVYWFGTEHGVVRYDGQTWQALPTEQGEGRVLALAQDRIVNALCTSCSDIFYRRSTDNGVTWSAPVNLSHSPTGSTKPQVKVDAEGGVHVTWDEGWDFYTGRGLPQSVAYTHSLDNGQTWSAPMTFRAPASVVGAPQQITLGIDGVGRLVAVWRVEAGLKPESHKVYYQVSDDHGRTWSAPQRLEGVNARDWLTGLDSYTATTDSAGHIHLALVSQTTEVTTTQYSLVHLEWDGLRWSAPEAVFTSEDLPEWPRLAIGGGNQVFLTWFVRPKEAIWTGGHYTVWAAHMEADAPHVAPTAAPSLLPSPTPTPAPPLPTLTPTPGPLLGGGGQGDVTGRPNLDYGAVTLMAIAALPAALWLAAVALGVRRVRR